jgi:hypothetical protein
MTSLHKIVYSFVLKIWILRTIYAFVFSRDFPKEQSCFQPVKLLKISELHKNQLFLRSYPNTIVHHYRRPQLFSGYLNRQLNQLKYKNLLTAADLHRFAYDRIILRMRRKSRRCIKREIRISGGRENHRFYCFNILMQLAKKKILIMISGCSSGLRSKATL